MRLRHGADDTACDYVEVLVGDPCVYCGGPHETIEHIDAVALGGQTTWENLASACRSCNCAKGKLPLLLFLHRCATQGSLASL